jgi:hypothetical protein
MERFPSDHEELVKFKSHLMGIGGNRRSLTAADNITTEISKMFLKVGLGSHNKQEHHETLHGEDEENEHLTGRSAH